MSTLPLAFDRVVAIGGELPGTQVALRHAAALADGLGIGLTALALDQDVAVTAESTWSSPILVVGSDGGSRLLSDGTTRRLLQTTVHPILVVGPSVASDVAPPTVERVVVSVDGLRASRAILPVAAGLARSLGSPVLFVHVIYPLVEASTGDASLSTEDEAMYDLLADLAVAWRFDGLEADWQVVQAEDPARGILSVVRRGDLLAAATHGRSSMGRLLFGSTIDALIRRSLVPVVTIAQVD
jgi:nucleotide-binding universal stress UspA family protein